MSPELFKYKPYNYKSDIWALGCVMYEICNLKHAFNAQTLNGLALKILKGNYMPISTKYSQKLRDLIMSMLNVNPKKRPSIFEIIDMPEIKKRVINYVVSLNKNPKGKGTYEDLYLKTVEDQCKVLGIQEAV
jgi:non-specific serine/threonine protein kinase/NIMA (never in mitosis gene a)-related kinase